LNILVAENDTQRASLHGKYLVKKGHKVTLSHTGLDCLKIYRSSPGRLKHTKKYLLPTQRVFDIVMIGDNMHDRKAIEVAKEIISINPHQRMIITSDNVVDTFYDMLRELHVSIEVLQYPVPSRVLLNRLKEWEFHNNLKNEFQNNVAYENKKIT
jgi:CheY-like chemotaxis protein